MPKQRRQRRQSRRPTVVEAAASGGGVGGGVSGRRKPFSFYILTTTDKRCTYGGVTTDVSRRLMQHNGVIGNDEKGSAHTRMRRAEGHGLWQVVLVVSGFTEGRSAHSLESWFHDQRRGFCKWNGHKKMAVRPQDLDIADETVSLPIRRAIALLLTLLTEQPGGRFREWPLQFDFYMQAAQPHNFTALFPASCTLLSK